MVQPWGMRSIAVRIARPLAAEDLARADALAKYRWGSSAGVVSYDAGVLAFLAPDAPWIAEDFARQVEAGEGVPVRRGRRAARKRR